MKLVYLLGMSTILFLSCGEKKVEMEEKSSALLDKVQETSNYPENMKIIFEAHGGIARWKNMNSLYFERAMGEDFEKTTVDLKTRKSITETNNYTLGYDGDKTWLVQDSTYMNPDRAGYMYNLMFYFLAMPFVLADEGINFSNADTLKIDGAEYPGVRISYKDGTGSSDKDEYIVYSDPETHKMKWLAYTATFGSEERSKNFSYIKYANWKDVNGLSLPTLLQWYEVEDGKPTNTLRSEQLFSNLKLSSQELETGIFEKPENGKYTSSK
ncbi:MAG: DUF6503 family protein [Leeuwenhoekiella sp.]